MSLKGKKIVCFLALPHHTRFFIPLRDEIKRQGGEILFFVTLSEYPYELDLTKRKLPFRYFTDYMTPELRRKINDSTAKLLDRWAKDCFKWDGFSRWPVFKQSWFFEAIVEEYFCVERFMEIEKPDLIMAHHECNRWGQAIGHLAYKKSIPFVTFQEGDYHGDYIGHTIHTQYSITDMLWGERTRDVLKSYKCSMDKIVVIGNTHIESAVKTYSTPQTIRDVKKELGIPRGKKVILFLIDIKYAGVAKKEKWEQFLNGLDKLDKEAVLIFKWHPSILRNAYEDIKAIFKELYPFAVLLDNYESYKLLAISDYCVTLGKTTLAIEALAFGKPLFAFPSPDTFEDYYVNIGVAQSLFPYGNWANLFNTMKHGVPSDIRQNVEKYLEHYFYKLDGKSVERAISVMNYVLECRQYKAKGKGQKAKGKEKEYVTGRVSFVMPSGSDSEALLATLTSISQNVKYPDWEVVLVINDENIKETLSGISGDVRVVEAEGNNLSILYNKGAEASTGEYLIFIKPGIVYFKDEGLIDAVKDGIAGTPLRNPDMTPYCLGIGYDFNFAPYKIKDKNIEPEAVGGGFIAMMQDVFESTGGFDEEIANHLIDTDMCLRANELDIPIKYVSQCLMVNYKETFYGEDISDENWENRVKFFAKWCGKLPKDDDFVRFAGDLLKV